MRVFALFVEPANYTQDAIMNVHSKLGVDSAFIFNSSKASSRVEIDLPVLSEMMRWERVKYVWRTLRNFDAFIINGYTNKVCLLFLILNILFFKKPYAIDSDTELRVPKGLLKRIVKMAFLKLVFGRKYAYGFAGGYHDHVALFTHYGMARERVFIDPMVVDNTRYARDRLPATTNAFTFGYLGRLVSIKQVDNVIDGVKKLTDAGLNVRLEIVGDGEHRTYLENCARGYTNIEFMGPKFGNEKVAALHQFDALILYSNYEPWGLVVNEALAAGIPCIVSDRVGARNDLVLGDEPTGLVVSYNDTEALAEAMKKLATDRDLWRQLSRAAVKRMSGWNYDLQLTNLKAWISKVEEVWECGK